MSLDITNSCLSESANKRLEEQSRESYSTLQRQRHYHSSLDMSREPKQIEIRIESPRYKLGPKHHHASSSSDNLLSPGSRAERQAVVTKSLVKKGGKFQSVGDICFTTSKEIPSPSREVAIQRGDMTTPRRSSNDRRKSRREEAELIFTSEKQHKTLAARRSLEPSFKASSCTNLSTRVIPIEFSGFPMSRSGSPATKYRTRVAVHGAA